MGAFTLSLIALAGSAAAVAGRMLPPLGQMMALLAAGGALGFHFAPPSSPGQSLMQVAGVLCGFVLGMGAFFLWSSTGRFTLALSKGSDRDKRNVRHLENFLTHLPACLLVAVLLAVFAWL
eukprot:TRINITY_DN70669_c0_g1_i1.p1 TRINITY_DN70669_c0_g1~~TRINITY_DN70669_c0_g1_i1.p1  ORF type:complete len:128 (+),score=16.49 TRINITY_DN70669_c0_g1_i1:23-385(+)